MKADKSKHTAGKNPSSEVIMRGKLFLNRENLDFLYYYYIESILKNKHIVFLINVIDCLYSVFVCVLVMYFIYNSSGSTEI